MGVSVVPMILLVLSVSIILTTSMPAVLLVSCVRMRFLDAEIAAMILIAMNVMVGMCTVTLQ